MAGSIVAGCPRFGRLVGPVARSRGAGYPVAAKVAGVMTHQSAVGGSAVMSRTSKRSQKLRRRSEDGDRKPATGACVPAGRPGSGGSPNRIASSKQAVRNRPNGIDPHRLGSGRSGQHQRGQSPTHRMLREQAQGRWQCPPGIAPRPGRWVGVVATLALGQRSSDHCIDLSIGAMQPDRGKIVRGVLGE